MSELEVPTEHLHETIHEKAHESHDRWSMKIALTTALIAVFAAITGLIAEHKANEALISQIQASDQWAYYQAKGIKSEVYNSAKEVLAAQHLSLSEDKQQKIEKYKEEQTEIKAKAEELQNESHVNLAKHSKLSLGITLFQIAIAISAIAILTRRRFLWYISLGFSAGGILYLILGLL
jgi:DNA mismatch repair ATPase MutL